MAPSILLVEDNEDDAALAMYALKRASSRHAVVRAHDGVEALDCALSEGAPVFDLILLDLQLPRLSGDQVLRRLRADVRTRFVPVVVLSCSDEPRDLVACYGLGANSYVRKPVDLGAFVRDLSLLLFYWLELNIPRAEEHPDRRERRHASEGVRAEQARARPDTPRKTLHGAAQHRSAQASGRAATVVVIDRDAGTRRRTGRDLREVAGSSAVVEADTGKAAYAAVANTRREPGTSPWAFAQLVLIDLDHNSDDAPRMITAIRAVVDHRLPIVVFTREDDRPAIDKCYALGVSSVVWKADDGDYDDTVRLLGHYWLRVNETLPPGARVEEVESPPKVTTDA